MTANEELPSYAEVATDNVNTVVTNDTEAAQLTEEKTNNNDETHSEIPISGCEVQCLATDEKVNTDVTEGGKANEKDEPTQPNSTDETVNTEVTVVTEQTTNNNERLDIFGNPQSKVPSTLTAAERNAYCYTNINCTDISFYGYIHWESHHTEGAVWLSLSGVFTCIVLGSFVWTRKYFNKSRGNQYCLVIVVWSATLMVIYGLVRLGLWIDSFFNAD
eukprot:566728_1